MTYSEAVNEVNSIEEDANKLKLYDWDEIFDFVPDSEEVKQDIIKLINSIVVNSEELQGFFK